MGNSRGQTNLWEFVRFSEASSETSSPIIVPSLDKSTNLVTGFDYISILNNRREFAFGDALVAEGLVTGASNAKNGPGSSGGGTPAGENDDKQNTAGSTSFEVNKRQLKSRQNISSTIDVVGTFPWTFSENRDEVPRIVLKEKYLRTNSIITQAVYYLLTISSKAPNVINQLRETGTLKGLAQDVGIDLGSVRNAIFNFFDGLAGDNPASNTESGMGSIPAQDSSESSSANDDTDKSFSQSIIEKLGLNDTNAQNILREAAEYETFGIPELVPYEGLYLTRPTGFLYHFPYFDDNINPVSNSFSAGSNNMGSLPIPGTKQRFDEDFLRKGMSVLNFNEPGTYIEKTKFYNFPQDGNTFNFSFPLLNTTNSFNDVIRNWQLVFMLIYQNKPNRITRDRVEPACIYEVNIPGVRFTPYAYVESLNIQFQGSRREMKIPVSSPEGGTTDVRAIIPDAYIVNITLKSLIGETRNLMSALLREEGLITTGETTTTNAVDQAAANFDNITQSLGGLSQDNGAAQKASMQANRASAGGNAGGSPAGAGENFKIRSTKRRRATPTSDASSRIIDGGGST